MVWGLPHSTRHPILQLRREFWEHRQGQHFSGGRFRVRELPSPVAKISIGRLEVDGNRVVDTRLYATGLQRLLQSIALRRTHRIDVVDMTARG